MISFIYKNLLSTFTLDDNHAEMLKKRGFSSEDLVNNGYVTFPKQRKNIIKDFMHQFNIKTFEGIPGFFKEGKLNDLTNKSSWELAGRYGIAIPVRKFDGEIVAIKIRSNKENEIFGKYTYLSSNPKVDKNGDVSYPNGTPAKSYIHYPIFNKNKASETLIITEGELKADFISRYYNEEMYAISIPGINLWDIAIDACKQLRPRLIKLAFDSDKNKEYTTSQPKGLPNQVGRALSRLYITLKQEGFAVEILDWDPKLGKGLDDVIKKGCEDKPVAMSELDAQAFCEKYLTNNVPLEWVYVIATKVFYNIETKTELEKEQFSDKYAHNFKKGKAADYMLKCPEFIKIDAPCYEPNKLQIFTRKNIKYLNLWTPSNITEKVGDAKLFFEHIEYLLPNKEYANILLDWLAFNVQYPGKKIRWSILLQGIEGTGKSYFIKVMEFMLGAENVSTPSDENLKEKYTCWAKKCSLVVISEIMTEGRRSIMNKLKPMITDDIVNIREMHRGPYVQVNKFNLLFLTNHEDAILIDQHDRRYCIMFSPAEKKPISYFEKLFSWTKKHKEEIYYHLKNRDLSNFNANANAPITEARDIVIKNSMSALQYWITDAIENKSAPFHNDVVSTAQVALFAPKNIRNANARSIGKILKLCGAEPLGKIRCGETTFYCWIIRDKIKWQNVSIDSIKKELLKVNSSIEYNSELNATSNFL